jgi:hypothetical protein
MIFSFVNYSCYIVFMQPQSHILHDQKPFVAKCYYLYMDIRQIGVRIRLHCEPKKDEKDRNKPVHSDNSPVTPCDKND